MCENCGKNPGDQSWCGDGGALAVVHGLVSRWCELCVVKAQVEHMEKMALALVERRARLAELEKTLNA